jgi:hypothetical protein
MPRGPTPRVGPVGGASYQPSGQRRVQPSQEWRPGDTVARRWSPLCAGAQRRLFPCDPHDGWARGHAEAAVTRAGAPGRGTENEIAGERKERGNGPVHGTA